MIAFDPGRWLAERENFGMRLGLERVERLLAALGRPQDTFRALHVVGTNGKSSTTWFAADMLTAQPGARVGAYLSPHLVSWRERIRIDGDDIAPDAFAGVLERVAAAAQELERNLGAGERVTQFEALTAAAFTAFAEHGVGCAVVEAGLGGRWDATNVLGAPTVALTNVALEHTRHLGTTEGAIARDKLGVVRPGATLVVGEGLHPDALDEARSSPAAEVVVAPPAGPEELAPFQRANLGVAAAGVGALTGGRTGPPAAPAAVPGRLELVDRDPTTVLDGAHNPSAVAALVKALPAGREVVAVVSVLEDKDAPAMLEALLPRCAALVVTQSSSPRALPAGALARLAPGDPLVEPDPHRALERARERAGAEGLVLATGSLTLVGDLARPVAVAR